MRTVTQQCVVRHASVSLTAIWLVTTAPNNQRSWQVAQLCVITKICEWIGPTCSANLLAWAHNALQEWWLLFQWSSSLYPNWNA